MHQGEISRFLKIGELFFGHSLIIIKWTWGFFPKFAHTTPFPPLIRHKRVHITWWLLSVNNVHHPLRYAWRIAEWVIHGIFPFILYILTEFKIKISTPVIKEKGLVLGLVRDPNWVISIGNIAHSRTNVKYQRLKFLLIVTLILQSRIFFGVWQIILIYIKNTKNTQNISIILCNLV